MGTLLWWGYGYQLVNGSLEVRLEPKGEIWEGLDHPLEEYIQALAHFFDVPAIGVFFWTWVTESNRIPSGHACSILQQAFDMYIPLVVTGDAPAAALGLERLLAPHGSI